LYVEPINLVENLSQIANIHSPSHTNQPYRQVVFCDFDGTITVEETFVAMLKKYTPELFAQLIPEIYALRLSLADGVRQLLSSIPSRCYPHILEDIRHQPLRPGFVELLDFLESVEIPLVVVSGGLRGMVEAALGSWQERVAGIYAAEVDTSEEFLQVYSTVESDTELVAKPQVMEQYNAKEKIAIGDSITDLQMAMAADLVFARDRLAQYLQERDKFYIEWQDFFDVRDTLATRSSS
jgi:2-hydroxy-3-keto-5-methylthiopentenyl-1-phosphate phosphatase